MLGTDGKVSMQTALIDSGSNRSMVLQEFAHQSVPHEKESVKGVGGKFNSTRKALIVMLHDVVASRMDAAYEVEEGIIPTDYVALLGTGAIARMDIQVAALWLNYPRNRN